MEIVKTYSPHLSFWDQHPQFCAAGPFKRIWESDKSRNKMTSSKLAWTIVLIWDRKSQYYNLPEDIDDPDSKITLLFEDVYGDVDYYRKNKEKVETLKLYYLKLQETPAMRSLREVEEKIEERSKFIKETPYELGTVNEKGQFVGTTAPLIDKMMVDTKKIYDVYEQALKIVESQNIDDSQNRGGGESSLSDTGEI